MNEEEVLTLSISPDCYELAHRRNVWIGVERPGMPGRGFDIRINTSNGFGLTIDIWMMNDGDIPGATLGPVALEPIQTITLEWSDWLKGGDAPTPG